MTSSIANALLQGWIDFNADGDWGDAGEQIITNLATNAGPNNIAFAVPAGAATDTTFARFRISTQPNLSFTGYASNGEVEDYLVVIVQAEDFGDAPDPSYPTLLASNGARHVISGLKLGALIDGETDGQPNAAATGDNLNGLPDEDGVTLLWGMNTGSPTAITVNASAACMLDAWADFNCDGDWADAGEQIFASRPLIAGNNILNFLVPATAVSDVSYFRYRVTSNGGLSYNGPAAEGEVEDYSDSLKANPGYKWIQPPHPSFAALHCHDGMNGGQLQQIAGADDWLCNGGIVTDIHWYGTYESQGSGIHHFHLGIFANDPNTCLPTGQELWSADVTLAQANQLATGLINNQGEQIYSYAYDLTEPFLQQQGTRYWLTIKSVSYDPNIPAMWKWQEATRNHLPALCPAAYRTITGGQQGNWTPYIWQGNLHTDFAFKITNQPAAIDFGDAPDPSYPTLMASNGARHGNNVPGVFLGALKDMEFNGQPTAGANGDDNNGIPDDEDGVIFAGPAIAGQPLNISVIASVGNCPLNAWMDFNCDGDWRDAGEKVFINQILAAGPNALVINIPPNAVTDTTYLRFRYATMGNLADTAAAPNGEVEDYMLVIQPDSLDYGDAPDPSYPTLLASNGARHGISNLFLGNLIDTEINGIPGVSANGDDLNNLDDEDGIVFTSFIKAGNQATLNATASQNGGYLNAWMDFNRDGDWLDAGEQIFTNQALAAGVNNLSFNVPDSAVLGKSYARFRLATAQDLQPTGSATDGEVEDYSAYVIDPGTSKMHYPQLPDLNPNGHGMDVDVMWTPTADDFLCTESGPINHIRLWMSFADDILPAGGPGNAALVVSIHADVPAQGENDWSKPGTLLWSQVFQPGSYTTACVADNIPEWWYDPATQWWQAANHFQAYRFDLPILNDPFNQIQGTVYWLKVQYFDNPPVQPDYTLGWKTTLPSLRWNDAAVWWNGGNTNFPPGWVPHTYPQGHPDAGQHFDMAFVIYAQSPPSEIQGTLSYLNANLTPMTTTQVILKQGGVPIATDITTSTGAYHLFNILPGSYTLDGSSTKPWGGVNSTDALQALKHFVHMITLTGLNAKAADVNAMAGINSVDAMMIARRYVGLLSSFPVGDWAFETPGVNITLPGTYYADYHALCYGDVDGSYLPPLKAEPAIELYTEGLITHDGGAHLQYPVSVADAVEMAALSLSFRIPGNCTIHAVHFNEKAGGNFLWHQAEGTLKISWFSIETLKLQAGEPLFTMDVNPGMQSSLLTEADPLSEAADVNGIPIDGFKLSGPWIASYQAAGVHFTLNVPNPCSDKTMLYWSLPQDAAVTLEIRNTLGELLIKPMQEVVMEQGTHQAEVDVSVLPPGIYPCNLIARTGSLNRTATIRIVVVR